MYEINIPVTTFKPSGKYYNEFIATVMIEQETYFHVSEAVRELKLSGNAPQLDLDWLIGMAEGDLPEPIANGIYPIIIKDPTNA